VHAIIDEFGAEKVIETILKIVGVPEELVLAEKPALKPRADEIGDTLRSEGYDLVALCETWNADLRDRLLSHWQLPTSSGHLAKGEPEGEAFLGDGLLFGSVDGRIVEVQRHGYHTRGIDRWPGQVLDMLADDELWAQKAVLLTRVNAGVGVIDIYLTHLYYGTGLAGSTVAEYFPHIAPPSNGERKQVRAAQLKELSAFIKATHNPANVAIVCGDFNIDANGKDPDYSGLDALQQFIESNKLQDRWTSPHGGFDGPTGGDFSKICASPQPGDPRFCLDSAPHLKLPNQGGSKPSGYRIDFLLVEHPQPQHTFMLDVTRVRRRAFPRPQVTENQAHMSDHLGLDCTLLASPLIG
jgi:hypothetical protein